MKLLFIYPDVSYKPISRLGAINLEPLALEYVAGALRDKDTETQILDLRVSETTLETVINTYQPHIVGISCSTFQVQEVFHLAQIIRALDANIVIVVGGYHVNLRPQDFFTPNIDYCSLGGGIASMQKIYSLVASGEQHPEKTKVVTSKLTLDYPIQYPLRSQFDLPYEAYRLGDKGPVGMVQTSSGCPYKCSYCDVIIFNEGKYLNRAVNQIMADILDVSADGILFADDESFLNTRVMTKLAEVIKDSGLQRRIYASSRTSTVTQKPRLIESWKECGLEGMFMGIDAIDQEDLDSFQKSSTTRDTIEAISILHELQIEIYGNFIILPTFTQADFQALDHFIRDYGIDYPSLTILTPLPGTPLWSQNGSNPRDYSDLDLSHLTVPSTMPKAAFMEQVALLRERVLAPYALAPS